MIDQGFLFMRNKIDLNTAKLLYNELRVMGTYSYFDEDIFCKRLQFCFNDVSPGIYVYK